MKKVKSFSHFSDSHSVSKLFEAVKGLKLEDDIDGMWELFEDIKSIEYIVEEAGYRILYNFMFKARKHDRYFSTFGKSILLVSEESLRSMIENNRPLGKFISINIEVAYPKDQVIVNAGGQMFLTPEQIEKLGADTERYCSLLKSHLDYVSSVERHSGGTGKNIVIVKL
jgi:hypothetical protein